MSDQPANPAYPQPEVGIEPDDLDTRMIVAIGLVSTALLVASVLGVTALVDQFQSVQVEEKVYDNRASNLSYFLGEAEGYGSADDVVRIQNNELSGYGKTQQPGQYTIPIDEAKDLVLKDLRASRGDKN